MIHLTQESCAYIFQQCVEPIKKEVERFFFFFVEKSQVVSDKYMKPNVHFTILDAKIQQSILYVAHSKMYKEGTKGRS